MKKILGFIVMAALIAAGCAAMFVPVTKDPYKKLAWAQELRVNQDRPLPAERLIREAISSFETEKNTIGLADAYAVYAEFLKNPGSPRWETLYRRDGFLDKTVTYDNKNEKALEYYEMAKEIYKDNNRYDRLTDVSLNIGMLLKFLRRGYQACQAYSVSLKSYHQYMAENPDAKPSIPQGFNSYDEFITKQKIELSCN